MKKNWKPFVMIGGLVVTFVTLATVFSGVMTKRAVAQVSAENPQATAGCTLATVTGNYGLLLSGSIGVGSVPTYNPYTVTGTLTADGAGNLTGTLFTAGTTIEGFEEMIAPFSATYTMSSSCMGTVTATSSSEKPSPPYKMEAVVVAKGFEIELSSVPQLATSEGGGLVFATGTLKKIGM